MLTKTCFHLMCSPDAAKGVHRNVAEVTSDLAARFCMLGRRRPERTGGERRVDGGKRAAFAGRHLANLYLSWAFWAHLHEYVFSSCVSTSDERMLKVSSSIEKSNMFQRDHGWDEISQCRCGSHFVPEVSLAFDNCATTCCKHHARINILTYVWWPFASTFYDVLCRTVNVDEKRRKSDPAVSVFVTYSALPRRAALWTYDFRWFSCVRKCEFAKCTLPNSSKIVRTCHGVHFMFCWVFHSFHR